MTAETFATAVLIMILVCIVCFVIFMFILFLTSRAKGEVETFRLSDYQIGKVRHKRDEVFISIEEWESARAKNAKR